VTQPSPRIRSHPRTRAARLTAGCLCLAVVLVGCGKEPVSIPTLQLSAADQAVCQRVVNALPAKVDGQSRRKTQPAEALAGAWGDPAIVAQCGVPLPVGFSRTASCQTADGVGWYVPDDQFQNSSSDIVISSAGYRPIVQVTIPGTYRPSGLAAAMVQLAPMVKAYTRLVVPCR
jgi:hypothetical protein